MGAHTLSVEVEVVDTNPSPSAELHINAAAGGHRATIYAQEDEWLTIISDRGWRTLDDALCRGDGGSFGRHQTSAAMARSCSSTT